MSEKFYLTTAIAYASKKPHFGNTYEAIMTDAVARYRKARGYDVFLCTGTDEHGQKIEDLAKDADGDTESNPEQGVGKADLPQDLVGHAAIIPNAKSEPKVKHASCCQLQSGDKQSRLQGAKQEMGMRIGLVQSVDKKEGQCAAKSHAPVGAAAPKQLDDVVANPSRQEQERKLGQVFQIFLRNLVSLLLQKKDLSFLRFENRCSVCRDQSG